MPVTIDCDSEYVVYVAETSRFGVLSVIIITVCIYILFFPAAMFNVNPCNVILVHDDLDKPVGKFSLKHGGSAG